ncbi:hypothetical protein KDL01_35190 [Actinospica durhamensis]|uniref:Uncharacterized protein n=1 Tax=Actinospica durhamensis TaxID=1508375 RepID=A0A941EX33_9ACTN|nr:hypothetical protein [Actinospica durhamensis]MBR7838566.1 hypothetical protein [Actinospica durhamensis]
MADDDGPRPGAYSGALPPADLPALRAYVEDVGRWVLGEADGAPLSPELRDTLAGELAAILADGLSPALSADVVRHAQQAVVGGQEGPVAFDGLGRLTVAGLTVPDVARLVEAVSRLMEHGLGESLDLLHESHRRALFTAHDAWSRGQSQEAE